MKQRLVARGVPASAIRVIPNWAQTAPAGSSACAGETFRRAHAWQGRFVAMHSDSLGPAHPIEALLDAAEQLRVTHPAILIAFAGRGARLSWAQQQVETRRLTNVEFFRPQPVEKRVETLSAADVHLMSMPEHLCGFVVPSTAYGALAAGRPCVFLGPAASEAARVIQQYRCGDVIPSPTGQTVASCLAQWAVDRPRWTAASRRLLLAASVFGVIPAAESFEGIFRQLVAEFPSPLASPGPELLPAHGPLDSR